MLGWLAPSLDNSPAIRRVALPQASAWVPSLLPYMNTSARVLGSSTISWSHPTPLTAIGNVFGLVSGRHSSLARVNHDKVVAQAVHFPKVDRGAHGPKVPGGSGLSRGGMQCC